MQLSVIIPAKNEERVIAHTVKSVFGYLHRKNISHEIIVVANNSTDRTAEIVKGLSAEIHTLKLIDYHGKPGKGLAVRKGMLAAEGDFRLFMDADNSTTIDTIEAMMPSMEFGYDVAIASIALKGSTVLSGSESIIRRLSGKGGNIFIQIVAVPGIWDTQRGFKMFSAAAARKIFSHALIDGWGFDVEVLALARKFGFKIEEVPIHWKNDPNTSSHPRLSAYFQVLRDTIRIRWYLMTGRYNRATI